MKLSISDNEINFWITNLYEIWSSEKEDEEVRILCKGTHALIRRMVQIQKRTEKPGRIHEKIRDGQTDIPPYKNSACF